MSRQKGKRTDTQKDPNSYDPAGHFSLGNLSSF